MKKKTNTTKKEKVEAVVATAVHESEAAIVRTNEDFKNAVLIVSLLVNVVILIAWIVLRITTFYDDQIAYLLFVR